MYFELEYSIIVVFTSELAQVLLIVPEAVPKLVSIGPLLDDLCPLLGGSLPLPLSLGLLVLVNDQSCFLCRKFSQRSSQVSLDTV